MSHGFIWLVIPLIFFFGFRGRWGGRPRLRSRDRALGPADREYITELRALVETQQGHIEALEARVAQVEEGLDFTERVLGERAQERVRG